MPTDARELSVTIAVTNGTGAYYFYKLHLDATQGYYHTYRFYDGYSKAQVLIDYGKIILSSAYIDDVAYTSNSSLVVRYR